MLQNLAEDVKEYAKAKLPEEKKKEETKKEKKEKKP